MAELAAGVAGAGAFGAVHARKYAALAGVRAARSGGLLTGVTALLSGLLLAAVALLAGRRALEGDLSIGQFIAIVGLGLIIAGILFAYFLNFVGIIIGLIMILGGIVALFMTWRRKKYPAT